MSQVIFNTGNIIFKNQEPLNKPPSPIDCETCLIGTTGHISRYNPKTRKCECVKDPTSNNIQSCKDRAELLGLRLGLGNYYQDDDCCCSCLESIKSDCESRGWKYIEPQIELLADFDGCRCDCNDRIDNDFYIKESECPSYEGVPVWNELTCSCECDKIPNFLGCESPFIVGPGCQCVCPPDSIPENGCPEKDGRQGFFDYLSCECVYPCSPGLIAYTCRQGGPYSDTKHTCAEPCKEGEYLSPCDQDGFRHCCENGSAWSETKKQCVYCELLPKNCDSPNQFDYRTCSCCPDGKIYDSGDNIFNLYNGECVCETVTDIYSATTIDTNECVAPRFVTNDCDCKCPDNKVWGRSPTDFNTFDCVDIEDRCPEYDENGDPTGPVDEYGSPIYTRWDTYDLECQCEKGNIDNNSCQERGKYLNTQTCECDCPRGSYRDPDSDESLPYDDIICICEEGKIEDFSDSSGRADCLTCEEIHGPNSIFKKYDDFIIRRNVGSCECIEGYTKQKLAEAENFLRPQCVQCSDYTPNSVWNEETQECDCLDGFNKEISINSEFSCIIVQTPSTTPTPTPFPS
jgi:hypothetical protein